MWFHKVVALYKHTISPNNAIFPTNVATIRIQKITNGVWTISATSTFTPLVSVPKPKLVSPTATLARVCMKVTSSMRLGTTTLIHVELSPIYLLDKLINTTLYKEHLSELNFQCESISYTLNAHLLTCKILCYYWKTSMLVYLISLLIIIFSSNHYYEPPLML